MENFLSLGRTRSATAANVRVWSATSPHTHSRARTLGSAPRSSTARVVANTDQVYVLKQFLERTGPDATSKEIEAVAAETRLDGKWIRQWIRRQVNGNRNKLKKGKKSPGSSTRETSTSSQVSRAASPDSLFTPVLQQWPPGQDLANPVADVQKFTFVALEGFEAGPKSRQHSVQSATSSVMTTAAHGGLVSLSSPPAGYDWNKSPFSHGYQGDPLNPHAHSSPIHTADPGASFMVPFRSEATYQHTTGVSSPDFHAGTAQWSNFKTTLPRNIREPELLANDGGVALQYGGSGSRGSHASSTAVFPVTTPRGPALQNTNVPDCLTAGSAYLYRLFHERLADAPLAAPLETPQLDTATYMAGLTRPSNMTDGRGPPLPSATLSASLPAFSHAFGHSAYPVAYQMRFSDLVYFSKSIQGNTEKDEGPSGSTFMPSETIRKLVHGLPSDVNQASRVQHGLDQSTSNMDPTRSQFLRVVVDAASSDVAREEGETEDEHEAVTPCETADLALPKGKRKEKLVDTRVVIVEASEEGA